MNEQKTDNYQLTLAELINMMLSAKYWMILSSVLAVGITYLYLTTKPDMYRSEMQIMITTDRYAGMSGGSNELAIISEVTGKRSYNSLANEQYILISTPVMLEVVNALHLNVRYYTHELVDVETGLHDVRLTYVPTADFDQNDLGTYRFDYVLHDDNSLSVTAEGPGFPKRVELFRDRKVQMGDTIALPHGEGSVFFSPVIRDTRRNRDVQKEEKPKPRFIYLYSPWTCARSLSDQLVVSVAESNINKASRTLGNNVSSILNVSLVDNRSKRSEAVLTKLVEVYNDITRKYLSQSNNATMEFIQNRLEDLAAQLSSIEGDLTAYSVNNRLIDLRSQTSNLISSEEQTRQRLQEVAIQERLLTMVQEELNTGERYAALPSNIGVMDAVVTQAIAEYNRIVMERSRLLASSSESSPVVIQLNASLDERKELINSSIKSTLSVLSQRHREIQSLLGEGRAMLSTLPTQSVNMAKIEREKSVIEPLYILLQRKREETMLSIVAEPNVARVIEPAARSSVRIGPDRHRFLAIAFLLGLLFPLGVLYVLRLLKTKIEYPEDITNRTSVPIIGLVPHSDHKATDAAAIVADAHSSRNSEVFRTIRANMSFLDGKVLQITSSVPGEGKSHTSTNIAISLAQAGRKVILVETDLRRGHLQRTFGLTDQPKRGLSHLLCGDETDWRPLVLHPEFLPELSLLCKGRVPPNPNELLMNSRMAELIEALKAEYDYVILDSPPFLLVADPITLNKYVDYTIYVMRSKVSQLQFCEEIEMARKNNKLTSPNIVLNDIDFDKRARYGSNYGYGYGYAYGYGYGYSDPSVQRSPLRWRLFNRKTNHQGVN